MNSKGKSDTQKDLGASAGKSPSQQAKAPAPPAAETPKPAAPSAAKAPPSSPSASPVKPSPTEKRADDAKPTATATAAVPPAAGAPSAVTPAPTARSAEAAKPAAPVKAPPAGPAASPAKPSPTGSRAGDAKPAETATAAAPPKAQAPSTDTPAPTARPAAAASPATPVKAPAAPSLPEAPVAARPAAPSPSAKEPAAKEPATNKSGPQPTPPVAPAAAVKVEPLPMHVLAPQGDVDAVLGAHHRDPFAFLGMHVLQPGDRVVVRAFLPQASRVDVVDTATGCVAAALDRVRDEGLFAGAVDGYRAPFAYRLRIETATGRAEVDDPYRFPSLLSEADIHLLAEGNHLHSYRKLGAHRQRVDGVDGVSFAVWAPNAGRVAVIGDFNDWDGRRHGMRLRHECGVWEIFIPGVGTGHLYKYETKGSGGQLLPDRSDPYAFQFEPSPGSAAVIADLGRYRWQDGDWMRRRAGVIPRETPISIYEAHAASWRRKPEEGHRCLTYAELAEQLVDYVKDMAFTHVQLLPVTEYDLDASLGYQPRAPYAPTSRWGTPDEFRQLVDRCHQAGIGVILDWVPNHFSGDARGLGSFDGTHLYEHPDPQRRHLPGSDALIYDYGRREVANFLISNALFWLDEYHVDALRIPGLAPMLHLDYGRSRGDWSPNRFGGHENLEAIDFLRRLNEHVYGECPGSFTVAEDNSGWPRVSHPTFIGGLGFGFKWNLDWVRDSLRYLSRNPIHRKYYHDEITHGPASAFQENFVLPLSHGEVAMGRGSMLRKMPGDRWQRFANLRTFYALMFAHPGKKLMFMGNEFAQEREWNSEISLDWHLLDDPMHQGMQRLVRDLNALYRSTPALYELDCEPEGFSWIDCNDSDQGVISFLRQGKDGQGTVVVVCHFTPVVRRNYRVGVPIAGFYKECLNTDAEKYGGGNVGNEGGVTALPETMHGRPFSVSITLPPFATLILEHKTATI
jgi:1,4-alpha-glucan branching enzyme